GDELLLVNLRGTSTNYVNAGNYEFLRVGGITGDTVYFSTAKTKWYGGNANDDSNIGTGTSQQIVALMRVPNYDDLTVNGTLTANAWDGNKYGLIVFRVSGTLAGSGTISANGLGYRDSSAINKGMGEGPAYDSSNFGGGYSAGASTCTYLQGGGGGYGTDGI